jgi:hypothetical protein
VVCWFQAAPPAVGLLLIFDRGYARAALIKDLNRSISLF